MNSKRTSLLLSLLAITTMVAGLTQGVAAASSHEIPEVKSARTGISLIDELLDKRDARRAERENDDEDNDRDERDEDEEDNDRDERDEDEEDDDRDERDDDDEDEDEDDDRDERDDDDDDDRDERDEDEDRDSIRRNSSAKSSARSASSQSSTPRSSGSSSSVITTPSGSLSGFRDEIFRLVNAEREKQGLKAYSYNNTLQKSAQDYAQTMQGDNCFSHTACGSTLKERMHASGYYQGGSQSYSYGENIARGQTTAQQVMRDWMNSPSHKGAILSSKYLEIGIGKSGNYWVQHFGAIR